MFNAVRSLVVDCFERIRGAPPLNRSVIALAAALVAWPAHPDSEYPPGLFENSPVVPSGPPDASALPRPPAGVDVEPPDAVAPLEDYCASVAGRTFHSLAEVRRAHARCDPPEDLPGQ